MLLLRFSSQEGIIEARTDDGKDVTQDVAGVILKHCRTDRPAS